jgi:hypothetical protein
MKETFELSNGRAVTVKSAWDCDKSVSLIDVYDADEGTLLAEYAGEIPDFDDEDFNLDKFVREVEEEIAWAENY